MYKKIDKLIGNNIIFHIYENNKQIYLACYENNKLIISRNGKGYISTTFNFYLFLKKLNAVSIKKCNDIEYIIYCEYFISKVSIIQRYWKRYRIRTAKIRNDLVLHGLAEYFYHPSRISFFSAFDST